MICKGSGGSIEVSEDFVTIRRTAILGFLLQHGIKGEKRIPYSAITAVQFKRAGITQGYIQFSIGGGNESHRGLLAASHDENSLTFDNRANDDFERARDFVEKRMGSRPAPQFMSVPSTADQLEKLGNLFDKGLLTKQEFDEQKLIVLKSSSGSPLTETVDTSKVPRAAAAADESVPASGELLRMQAAMDKAIEEKSRRVEANAPTITFGKRR
jgi:Short C-terminal domain/Domain of unknown function (DUF4429)